jgi:hypothetical protein
MNSSFITRAGFEFPSGLPLIPSVRLFLAVPWLTLEPGCLTLGEQLRVDSGRPTTPADYGPAEPPGRRPPAPGPQLIELTGRSPDYSGPHSPRGSRGSVEPHRAGHSATVPAGLRFAHYPCRLRFDRTPWPPTSCARSSTLSNFPGGTRITPDHILLAVPRTRLSLTVLVTRPRCRLDSGLSRTPADCGPAEPPDPPWRGQAQLPIALLTTISRWLTGTTLVGSSTRILSRRPET